MIFSIFRFVCTLRFEILKWLHLSQILSYHNKPIYNNTIIIYLVSNISTKHCRCHLILYCVIPEYFYCTVLNTTADRTARVSVLTNSCPDKDPESVFRSHLLMSEPKGFPASAGFLPLLVWEWRSNRKLSLPLSQSLGQTQLSKKDLYPPFTLPHPHPILSCDPALKRVQVKNTQLGWTSAETDLLSVSQGVSKRTPSILNQTTWLN